MSIPICLISGFLGSGKTSYLTQLTRRFQKERWAYLVNEFSVRDVDGLRLKQLGLDVHTIPGGSIFCKCLLSEFILALSDCPARLPDLTGVVVEASGIADPGAVDKLLRESGMDRLYHLASVICLIDPGQFHKLLKTLPAVKHQVQSADVLLVNKCDLYGSAEIDECCALLQTINAGAKLLQTEHGAWPDNPFLLKRETHEEGELALCRDPAFERIELSVSGFDVDIERLVKDLCDLQGELYRAKGWLKGKNGMCYVDASGGRCNAFPCEEERVSEGLVMIVDGIHAARAFELQRKWNNGAYRVAS